jgi:oxalate decarboxylase/phosphoglucose isomerase-like protein (cupin superfamily)
MHYFAMFDEHSLDTNLFFLHRGAIDPKSGVGHHFHNQCEEMFVILDGEAQFTIDVHPLNGFIGSVVNRVRMPIRQMAHV